METIKTDFQSKINKLFSYLTIQDDIKEDFCMKSAEKIELRSYQKFAGDYLTKYEYIRGLLIIHGLGSGKTWTSMYVINKLPDRDIVIVLPASLRGEWERELGNNVDKERKINFISYNAPNVMEQYYKLGKAKIRSTYDPKKENNFNNKLVIIEESHVFFQNAISGGARQAIELWNKMYESKNSKFLLLTGTPISGDPYELAPIINLLRKTRKGIPLFPISYSKFHEYFVSTEFNSIKNKEVFQDRITGLVSYYKGIKDPNRYVIPEYLGTKIISSPMGKTQWVQYLTARSEELDFERRSKFNKKAFKQEFYKKPKRESVGTYKVMSAQNCNFSFPSDIEKKFKNLKYGNKIKSPTEFKWNLLKEKYGKEKHKDFIAKNIEDLSGKISLLFKNITNPKKANKKIFIFSRFKILGVRIIGILLEHAGYKRIDENDIPLGEEDVFPIENKKSFIIIDGDVKDKSKMFKFYNRKDNSRGEKCRIVIGTSVVAAGVNFFDVREEHILEPQWRSGTIDQIKGRGIRTCSHSSLPIKDRDIIVYLYLSIPPDRKKGKSLLLEDKGLTTDEFLYSIAKEREVLNNSFVAAIKEAAVDCKFNLIHNDLDGFCRYCINEPPSLLFPDDIKKHIIEGSYCVTQEKRVNLSDFKYEGIDYKIDSNNNLYLWSDKDKAYSEIGFYDKKNKVINLEGEGFDF